MDTKERIKKLRRLIKKSLGQGGPLSNPTKCVAVERITSEGLFVIKRDFDEQREDYEADYAYLLREVQKIYEANKDLLSRPPIESDCIRGEQRLDDWCLESLEKLKSKKAPEQKTKKKTLQRNEFTDRIKTEWIALTFDECPTFKPELQYLARYMQKRYEKDYGTEDAFKKLVNNIKNNKTYIGLRDGTLKISRK